MTNIKISNIISDKFNLPIEESTDVKVSLDTFIAYTKECIDKLNKINLKVSFNEIDHFEVISGFDITSSIKVVGEFKYIFSINKAVLRTSCLPLFDTIIYHELCHILQVDYLFTIDIVTFNYTINSLFVAKKNYFKVKEYLLENTGHTHLWWGFVGRVNRLLIPSPKVALNLDKNSLDLIFKEENSTSEYIEIPTDFIVDNWPEIYKL